MQEKQAQWNVRFTPTLLRPELNKLVKEHKKSITIQITKME